jgi:uncharacterized DUF497 family protein
LSGENKRESNLSKHNIDFNRAKDIRLGSVIETTRSTKTGEERVTVVGKIEEITIAVVYTKRGGAIRIISARHARRSERAYYKSKVGGVRGPRPH